MAEMLEHCADIANGKNANDRLYAASPEQYEPGPFCREISMKVNWDNRLRDGFLYAIVSGVTLLLLSFFYQIHTIHSQVFFVILLFPWWFLTVQAIRRLFPEFIGDLDYTVYKIKKMEAMEGDQGLSNEPRPVDPAAKEMSPAQTSPKRQPTSEEFWRAQRADPNSQSRVTEALISSPRIVPVSYPTRRRPMPTLPSALPSDLIERERERGEEPSSEEVTPEELKRWQQALQGKVPK